MQTYLISSNDPAFVTKEIQSITRSLTVSAVNYIEVKPVASVTIAEVRKISQIVLLKPYGGGDRVIVIYGFEKATTEAGNALLKILEEPPPDNYIILVSDNVDGLLPTIVSRCQIITNGHQTLRTKNTAETKKFLKSVICASTGERIMISQKIASREEGLLLLRDLTAVLENLLHEPDREIKLTPYDVSQLIGKTTAAKKYLERYINFKATLDVLFLGFPKIEK